MYFFVEKGLDVFSVPVRFSDLTDNIDIIFRFLFFIKVKNIPPKNTNFLNITKCGDEKQGVFKKLGTEVGFPFHPQQG